MLAALTCCALGLAAGCGDDDGGGKGPSDGGVPDSGKPGAGSGGGGGSDGGGAGGTGGGGTGGTITPPPPLTCGGEPCMVSAGAAMLGTTACCTDDDTCGGQSLLFSGCVEIGQAGNYDESCPAFSFGTGMGGFTLNFPGCCTEAGQCGAFDTSNGGFGCIPADALPPTDGGVAMGQSCTYDPSATCTRILAAHCDGPEDCGSGKQCCGRFGRGGYAEFTCEDSCVELAASTGSVHSEVCHPGGSCDQPLPTDGGMPPMTGPDGGVIPYECRKNTMYLPEFWFRCRDTGDLPSSSEAGSVASGEINCGGGTCGSGQKCCYALSPAAPADGGMPMSNINDGVAHCVAADQPCTCGPGSDGDAG